MAADEERECEQRGGDARAASRDYRPRYVAPAAGKCGFYFMGRQERLISRIQEFQVREICAPGNMARAQTGADFRLAADEPSVPASIDNLF